MNRTYKAVVVLCCLFIGAFLVLWAAWSHAWYATEGKCVETECSLCGKSICYWQPGSLIDEGIVTLLPTSNCDSQETPKREISIVIDVCPECHKKYADVIQEKVDQFISECIETNKKLFEKHKTEKRNRRAEDLINKILDLEKQLKELTP